MIGSTFRKTTLPNGLRVLTERHPYVHSATLGIWVQAGAIYETQKQSGLAHLLEHMVFKGTQTHSAREIAEIMDVLGGQMNAFTEREWVCYHAKTLSENAPRALELLCQLATIPNLDADDLEIEKSVVVEEIRSVEDVPEELVEDVFAATIWPRSRWGRSILGSEETVSSMKASDLREFMKTHYSPRHTLVAAVGDVEHDEIVAQVSELLSELPGGENAAHRVPPQPKISAKQVMLARDVEQVHLCCGTRAYANDDPRRFAAFTLDAILTGGYSSRLFQEIREKRGLCYSIGSSGANYRTGGYWAVATSVAPESAQEVAKLIGEELRRVKKHGVTEDELARANQMTRTNLLLGEESSSAQMGRIARNEWNYGRQRSTQEVLDDVLAVTQADIQNVANEMFDEALMTVAAVGPFEEGAKPLKIEVG